MDYSEAIPAFICIIFMPLAYSISDGIVLGMISYVLINLLCGHTKKLTLAMYILASSLSLSSSCKLFILLEFVAEMPE